MRISDWSSDVCSSDLPRRLHLVGTIADRLLADQCPDEDQRQADTHDDQDAPESDRRSLATRAARATQHVGVGVGDSRHHRPPAEPSCRRAIMLRKWAAPTQSASQSERSMPTARSEEHTSELQSLMRISYAVFCLKKKKRSNQRKLTTT